MQREEENIKTFELGWSESTAVPGNHASSEIPFRLSLVNPG